eukprot:TRINITY_DN8612_c2_g1_i1.p1 TRINITY_DN8612_c2_g1~~TRINITY_DN8612_c2_g1_i1.p1  ORF type:complete len:538 (+),score=75.31 TRINITY_DN8612_c2_g1_i1:41-1654(+)
MDAIGQSASSDAASHDDRLQRVLKSLVYRAEVLLRTRWSTAVLAEAASLADLEAASLDLPVFVTELQSIKVVLRHLHPDTVGVRPMQGLLIANFAMRTLEQHMAAVKKLLGSGERPRQHRRAEFPATVEVLANNELLAEILAFTGRGEYLFVAPVSRRVRALYVATVASAYRVTSVHSTEVGAALYSQSRLNLALSNVGFTSALPSLSDGARCDLCIALGLLGSAEAVERVQAAGLRVGPEVLIGTADTRNVAHLHSVWAGPLNRCKLDDSLCRKIGLRLSACGDDGSGLSWLVLQLPTAGSWPAWYINALCNEAAQWGQITTLQFLLERGQALFGALGAVSVGDDDNIRRESSLTYPDTKATRHAAVLQWLQSWRALEFTPITMQVAAANTVLPSLKWLRARGCPHDIHVVFKTLLRSRHATPPIMAWARACGGGDWSARGMADMLVKALSEVTPALARWLRAEGAQWPKDLAAVVRKSAARPLTVLWAVQQGCPFGRWTSRVCERLERRHGDGGAVKRALHDLGCPCACPRPHAI